VTDRGGQRLGWRASLVRFAAFAWGPAAWAALGGAAYWAHHGERVSFVVGKLGAERLWEPALWLLSWAVLFVGYLGGFLLAAFHPQKRALHDLAAHSDVLRRGPRA
jgi:hypothetical protein